MSIKDDIQAVADQIKDLNSRQDLTYTHVGYLVMSKDMYDFLCFFDEAINNGALEGGSLSPEGQQLVKNKMFYLMHELGRSANNLAFYRREREPLLHQLQYLRELRRQAESTDQSEHLT